ncbi:uncharacterized protein L969DRAFT_54791 [Mixia osmundae IAM 14324]|uniref:Selenoprotein O n=1 Tax=Mixia osmundae (strain CBS 9802 / IAM 14324 / JCM 22182 / KY 12970) TaxID=764103 RepID=G7DW21_MIXOS|nr:uncharacterized protein L969DRAFT_54791 [Mixia osmundae IAM 14324]KEI36473.1 hypothetical protein L969DRAFT_54791 [Mixia osmundae IAM 14324]GAA94827.1 hypothetical protein E5Q_01481 [Mixia osmundae IAM 14324]
MARKTIDQLPLGKSLPQFLKPDPLTPSVEAVLSLHQYDESSQAQPPSMLRRSRQITKGAHFSFVTPLPIVFPYNVQDEPEEASTDDSSVQVDGSATVGASASNVASPPVAKGKQKELTVEDWLARLEPDFSNPVAGDASQLAVYSSRARNKDIGRTELLGLSQTCRDDILPELDIESSESRQMLADVLGAKTVLAKPDAFAPHSLCYAGYQFGSNAGQLGDGRAISILTSQASTQSQTRQHGFYYPPLAELQLKGAGRTPYSRFADGLAVLRSSVREYLGSEAMAALGVPTSRALSLVHLPDVHVEREKVETAAVVCRVAPSWLRVGSFHAMFQRQEWDSLLQLAEYAGTEVLGFGKPDGPPSAGQVIRAEDGRELREGLATRILRDVSKRTAYLTAKWQAVGFMHGVLNTDNISLLGLTIDYGPYAFMDKFDASTICNHSDDGGRYSYKNQPSIGVYNIRKLGEGLSVLIGYESEHGAAKPGWAEHVPIKQLQAWVEKSEPIIDDVAQEFTLVFMREYKLQMVKRLGLLSLQEDDFAGLITPLLDMMEAHELDYAITLRMLCQFESVDSPRFDTYLNKLVPKSIVPTYLRDNAHSQWRTWLGKWQERLEQDEASHSSLPSRTERMRLVNPRFVLRQWILEETIKRLEQDKDTAFLERVLAMSVSPFDAYGEEDLTAQACAPETDDLKEQRRLCSQGPKELLGFQCSCSS